MRTDIRTDTTCNILTDIRIQRVNADRNTETTCNMLTEVRTQPVIFGQTFRYNM